MRSTLAFAAVLLSLFPLGCRSGSAPPPPPTATVTTPPPPPPAPAPVPAPAPAAVAESPAPVPAPAAPAPTPPVVATETGTPALAVQPSVPAAQRRTDEQLTAGDAAARQSLLASLRQAAAYANNNQLDEANRIYAALLDTPNASREMIAAAATGLYRTGDYRHAAEAFRRLSPFSRGEEDLRYYNAVSLFETGQYDAAKKELACALPYIQVTDDVARYRDQIERMAAQQPVR